MDDSDRGAVLVVVALLMTTLLAFSAMTIDLGRLMIKKRDLQALADIVAIDLGRELTGLAYSSYNLSTFDGAKSRSVVRNGGDPTKVTATLGTTAIVSNKVVFTAASGSTVPTAVKVAATDTISYFFAPVIGQSTGTTNAAAVAGTTKSAYFKVGSFLAALDPASSSIAGQLLNQLAPGLAVVGYGGLASGGLTLQELGLYMPFGVLTPDAFATTQVSVRDVIVASASALVAQGGQSANVAVLNNMLAFAPTVKNINLGTLVGIQAAGGSPAGTATVNVLQLLTTAAFIADGTHAITIPAATVNVPGVGNVAMSLTGIEAEQIGGPNEGASVTTSQVKLTVTPTLSLTSNNLTQNVCGLPSGEQNVLNALIGGVLNLVSCLLGPLNKLFTVSITGSSAFSVTAASATVTQHIDCNTKQLQLTPVLGALTLDSQVNLDVTAAAAGVPFTGGPLFRLAVNDKGNITSTAPVQTYTATGTSPYTTFTPPSTQVGSVPLGLAPLLSTANADVTLLNMSLPVLGAALKGLVAPLLNNARAALDTQLITPLANLLGINLGGAKLTPLSMDCGSGGPKLLK
ncbi:MAG: hypothetical protein ABIV94_12435 [Acidimicrobiales bacterium]